MAKRFELEWIFEGLSEDPSFSYRHMFGGKAAYYRGKMIFCIMESKKDADWYGVLIPTEKEFHESLRKTFPSLVEHPVLRKWLYLPITCDSFEKIIEQLTRLVLKDDFRIGIFPKPGIKIKKR